MNKNKNPIPLSSSTRLRTGEAGMTEEKNAKKFTDETP